LFWHYLTKLYNIKIFSSQSNFSLIIFLFSKEKISFLSKLFIAKIIHFSNSSILSFFNKNQFLLLVITSFAHSFGVATIIHQKFIACNSVVANPHQGELG
jgi:hypothetical protein